MTDNERRVLDELITELREEDNDAVKSRGLAGILGRIRDADAEPTRPFVGEQFWMRVFGDDKWSVWTATPGGPETQDTEGELWVATWSEFDRYVADGTWEWMALEQPHD